MSVRVIVVEDNEDLLFLYRTAMEQKGYEVHEARSAASVLELIEQFVPALIVLDIEMPGGTGIGVVDAMRENPIYDDSKIIVVTANDRWRERLGDRVNAFLVKPVGIAHLLKLATDLLGE